MSTFSDPIVIEHATKKFGAIVALQDVSFTVTTGETFGLIGPNGSGKTTLFRTMLGLNTLTTGTMHILGEKIPAHRIASKIGYMSQSGALYSDLSITENLAFFGVINGLRGATLRTRIKEVVELVDLTARIQTPVYQLSGGMRQRVSLAIALLHNPQILFLDEPTVGIDPELRVTFWSYFARLNAQGVTIVISTHYLDEAERCQRIGLLRFGALLAVNTPAIIQQESGERDFEKAFLYYAHRQEQEEVH